MLILIRVLALLEAVGANKIKVFEWVAIDPAHIIEITPENKIVILARSQQGSRMTCHKCRLSGHWSRTCLTKKHFVDLYQASLDKKGKQVESYAVVLEETGVEANNALVMYNSTPPIDIKNLDVSEFFQDPNGKIRHLIGGGLLVQKTITKFYLRMFIIMGFF